MIPSVYKKSTILETLEKILAMQDKIRIVSDMAFDAVDKDGDCQLNKTELGRVLKEVSKLMKIQAPTENDVTAVL